MIPTPEPASVYEVYPRTPPLLFKSQFLLGNPILIESFCMKEHIDSDRLPSLIDDVLIDWELSEETHRDRKDAVKHLINHIRIKLRNEQRNNPKRQGSYAPGGDTSRNERMARIAQEILRQSSGGHKP